MLGGLFVLHLARFYGWSLPWSLGLGAAGLLVLRSVGSAWWFLARHPFVVCDFGLSEAAVPGGSVRCSVRIVARRRVRLTRVRVALSAESRRAGGEARRLFFEERELAAEAVLDAGSGIEEGAALEAPEDAPFSYRSFEGRLRWMARAEVEAEGFGVVAEEIEVLMAPPPPPDSAEDRAGEGPEDCRSPGPGVTPPRFGPSRPGAPALSVTPDPGSRQRAGTTLPRVGADRWGWGRGHRREVRARGRGVAVVPGRP